jgi:PAS domain S-box-containing protein
MVLCDIAQPGHPIVYANPAFLALTGYSLNEVMGRGCGFLRGPQTDVKVCAEIRRALAQGDKLTTVVRNYRRDGSPFWNRLILTPLADESGRLTYYVGMQQDVSDELRRDVSLQMLLEAHGMATETGRSFIAQRVEEALADHLLTGRQHALVEVRLHIANDDGLFDALTLDGVGATVGSHLRKLIPARASMSALSDLRFAVVLPLIGASEEAEMLATGLLAELPIPLECREHPVRLTVAAGVALLPRDGNDANALLAAVQAAAQNGLVAGNEPLQFVSLQPSLGRASTRLLEFDLHNALAKEQFHLVFQPQVHLATGSIVGFEALLRWDHPVRGPIAPADFIPVVEDCGMAGVVTRWVLEQSVRQLRAWEDLGHHGLQMAVNAPPSVFETPDISDFLLQLLSQHEIAGNQIELELTERTLTDANPSVIARLQALRRHGISVAIDDFGTGYSNLSYLTRLPLDCLKIDLSFVHGAVTNPSDAMVARMTCELARALRLRIVVEGIETEGQLQFFTNLRCELAQGYFFARPMEATDANAMLAEGRNFAQPASQKASTSQRHLLLLDDEPNILRSLRRVFRGQPWTVHTAVAPEEALELLARHPVGVVMSDQRMPLMRGTDFLARVKQLYPDTVRIVLSGYTELQSVTEAINEGAIYKFLTKPWNDVQINEEIEQAFRQFEMVAEGQRLQQRLRDSNRLLENRLHLNQERLLREEAALDVTHEALGVVPVPILGIDASGMIAISNAAADLLLGAGASVVGEHVNDVLPCQGPNGFFAERHDGNRQVQIGGVSYQVRCNDLGVTSRGTGTVITLLQEGAAA